MRSLADLPIKRKLTGIIMIVSLSALAVACVALGIHAHLAARDQLVRDLSVVADIIAENSRAPLLFEDARAAEDVLKSLRAHGHVISASIYHGKAERFASYQRTPGQPLVPVPADLAFGPVFSAARMTYHARIGPPDDTLGALHIVCDLGELDTNRRNFLIMVAGALAAAIGLAFLLSGWLQHLVTGPLLHLAGVVGKVGRERDYSVRAVQSGKDELGELITGFNGMLAQIQSRDADLQSAHDDLEGRVQQRTAELDAANRHLQQLLAENRESQAQLLAASRAKDEFLAAMSHELRTPLNAVLGFSEVLQEELQGPLNVPQKRSVSNIQSSGAHLLSLINDILDLAKIEAGKESLQLALTEPWALCEASLKLIRPQALKKKLQVDLNAPRNLPALLVDARRVRQILVNLLNNAVKFTPEGGRIGLEVARLEGEGRIRFTVWDTGIGISEANRQKLFKPFVQVDSRLSRQYEGTGLGLSLALRLAEIHGGSLEVESQPGQGSRFSLLLPVSVAPPSAEAQPRPPAPAAPVRTHRPRVLLVEDNERDLEAVKDYLDAKGFDVRIAHDGKEALAQTLERLPDLILMDIQMPGVDGLEATRQLRQRPETARLPIIALTALAMEGDRELCMAAGATDYFSKPVSLSVLTDAIERRLSASETRPLETP